MTGWRAQDFAGQALSAPLEGRDLRIVGVVASLPQDMAQGIRWRMEVEQARIVGPPLLRSLDAIHLATAVALAADEVWTYDQRRARTAEELGILSRMPG